MAIDSKIKVRKNRCTTETFKAPPADAQKAYDAILAYARKRPIVKTM